MSLIRFSANGKQRLRAVVFALLSISTLGLALTSKAAADVMDKKTIVTFNAPVEIPGKALPAGTYVFKLLDSQSNRTIVQVFDKDEKQLIATILGIPDYRMDPPDKPIIGFEERPSDTPMAVKEWFYPGDQYGVQFVYPQDRATQIAKRTHQNVLSMRNDMQKNMANPAQSANAPSVQQLEKTDVTGVSPSGEPVDVNSIVKSRPQQ
ncbi:MAG: hypothetical protein JWO80_1692 [Bryobacterales bacterium]|nr:hypothetical protein [Bryobacterales bacterium]